VTIQIGDSSPTENNCFTYHNGLTSSARLSHISRFLKPLLVRTISVNVTVL
jgi:hypothetical protein